jgi:uncharacterized protein (DUF305 family)
MKKFLGLVALLVASTHTLAACGSNDSPSASGSSSAHNKQDVTFASDMIPHHQQAIQMAKMAKAHAGATEVKQLANGIESAQGPEIKTMTGWLKALGQDAPSGSMSGMGGKGGSSPNDMPGMMSDTDMAKLGRATGATFDQMWLKGMIAHHEGAVEMANTEIAKGKNGDAIDLAKSIKAAQAKEIAKMKNMLGS